MDAGLAAYRHYRGNQPTIATQRVTIGVLFGVHPKTLRLADWFRRELK
jgi:hypothetical protein